MDAVLRFITMTSAQITSPDLWPGIQNLQTCVANLLEDRLCFCNTAFCVPCVVGCAGT